MFFLWLRRRNPKCTIKKSAVRTTRMINIFNIAFQSSIDISIAPPFKSCDRKNGSKNFDHYKLSQKKDLGPRYRRVRVSNHRHPLVFRGFKPRTQHPDWAKIFFEITYTLAEILYSEKNIREFRKILKKK